MSISIETPYLQFTLEPATASWSLHGPRLDSPSLEDVWMRVNYRMGPSSLLRTRKIKFQFLEKWFKPRLSDLERVSSPHGELKQITVQMGPDVNGIHYQLVFALSVDQPLFLWRLGLENKGQRSVDVSQIEMLRAGFFPKRRILPVPGPLTGLYNPRPVGYGAVRPHPDPGELGFFSNGWQSWSYTGAYGPEDIYRATRVGSFAAQMWYPAGKAPRRSPGRFTSDMFGLIGDRTHRTAILAGFLSQVHHFGSLEAYIGDPLYPALSLTADGDCARLEPGARMSTDWAIIQFVDLDAPDPFGPYLEAVAREHALPVSIQERPSPSGWCSWYHFFQDIDEGLIRRNLNSAREMQDPATGTGRVIPLDIVQIDDGFEAQIGDWLEFSPGFPQGVAPLAREIAASGFTPGLWLAPFIVHSGSKLARKHRHWLLRNRFGLAVNAGFGWNNFNKALDLTHPEALDYTCRVVHTAVQEWGFPYLKLDFLYAAALKGRYRDRTKTRAQVLRMGFEAVRAAAGPEATLLGCGTPLGPSIGIFDALRVGADIDPHWEPHFLMPQALFRPEPNMPAARNAIQNAITRAFLHKRWWINDPDCLLLRPSSSLSLAEVQSVATTIAMTGGSLMFSDDLPDVPANRLRIAEQLLPLLDRRPRVLDWFDSTTPQLLRLDLGNPTGAWHLLAVFNWEQIEVELTLPLQKCHLPSGEYFIREFWTGDADRVSGDTLALGAIPAHGVRLFSLRPVSPNAGGNPDAPVPVYLGSDLHISQGLEVFDWAQTPSGQLRIGLNRPGKAAGVVDLYLPRAPENARLNQVAVEWQSLGAGLYRFQLEFSQKAVLEISLES